MLCFCDRPKINGGRILSVCRWSWETVWARWARTPRWNTVTSGQVRQYFYPIGYFKTVIQFYYRLIYYFSVRLCDWSLCFHYGFQSGVDTVKIKYRKHQPHHFQIDKVCFFNKCSRDDWSVSMQNYVKCTRSLFNRECEIVGSGEQQKSNISCARLLCNLVLILLISCCCNLH